MFGFAIINLFNDWPIPKSPKSVTWNKAPNRNYLGAIITITKVLIKSNGAIPIFMSDDSQVDRLLCRRLMHHDFCNKIQQYII